MGSSGHAKRLPQPYARTRDSPPGHDDELAPPGQHDIHDGPQAVGEPPGWIRTSSRCDVYPALHQASDFVSPRSSADRGDFRLLLDRWWFDLHA